MVLERDRDPQLRPRPGLRLQRKLAAQGRDAVGDTAQTVAGAHAGAAVAVVGDDDP